MKSYESYIDLLLVWIRGVAVKSEVTMHICMEATFF